MPGAGEQALLGNRPPGEQGTDIQGALEYLSRNAGSIPLHVENIVRAVGDALRPPATTDHPVGNDDSEMGGNVVLSVN